jgi:alpha-glucoside transport system permease protein
MTKEGAMAVKAKAKSKKRTKPIVPSVMKQGELLPWLFAAPSFLIMVVYVVYPTINTIILSLKNSDGSDWATAACQEGQACWGVLENYRYALTSEAMLTSFRNNLLWMFLMVLGTTALGLVFAVLVDKVKYESLAKALIFMPMAISFVGAGVIWGFMYDFPATEDSPVIGLLNALVLGVGGKPIPWLIRAPWINNIALIFVGIWMWTGFCMTILSAAIKGVPGEILEAARVDGANEFQVFWSILVPMIMPTITVVLTTMTINTLKIFDIVYVMTGGNYGTDVIAKRMIQEMYVNLENGRASAIAVVLILLIVPVMIFNVRRFQEQEAIR